MACFEREEGVHGLFRGLSSAFFSVVSPHLMRLRRVAGVAQRGSGEGGGGYGLVNIVKKRTGFMWI